MSDVDFVVVGGGIYGTALAFELAATGASVTLLEAGRLAERASGGVGKRGVRASRRNSRELPLIREALGLWPALSDRLGSETGFEQLGGLMLINSQPQVGEIGVAQAEAHLALQRAFGITTDLLSREELRAIEPGVGGAEIAALHCPDEGIADQRRTTHAYAAAAQQQGVTIAENTPAMRVGTDRRPWVELEDGSRIEPRRSVVLTTNYGTNALLERSDLMPLPLWTMVPQVLLYRALDGYQPRHLIGHMQQKLAVKPLDDGITMISGGMRGKWDAGTSTGTPVDSMIEESLRVAVDSLPMLEGGSLVEGQAGLPETYTPDGLPFIDFLDDQQQLFVASGWHGHGFAIAPSFAQYVAEWLTTGHRPEVLAPFQVPRRSRSYAHA